MLVSEIFISQQGEGPYAGRKAIFLRLAGCNLRCYWCDTKYAWLFTERQLKELEELVKKHNLPLPEDAKVYDLNQYTKNYEPKELAKEIMNLALQENTFHLVITGGEPLIQQSNLNEFLIITKDFFDIIEIETNGTYRPRYENLVDIYKIHYNVSLKLSNSLNPENARLIPDAIEFFKEYPKAIFKFVVGSEKDLEEVEEIVRRFRIPREKVWLMPLTGHPTDPEYDKKEEMVKQWAKQKGFKYSPRLQIKHGFK